MKKILLVYSLLAAAFLNTLVAQTSRQVQPSNTGSFYVNNKSGNVTEKINVNYVISQGPIINQLSIMMNTPNAMLLSCRIVDGSGKTYMGWMPEKSNTYSHEFDITNLSPGKYVLQIYGEDNSKVYSINFEKSAAANNSTQQSNK